jgi:hypothetical protein
MEKRNKMERVNEREAGGDTSKQTFISSSSSDLHIASSFLCFASLARLFYVYKSHSSPLSKHVDMKRLLLSQVTEALLVPLRQSSMISSTQD